MSPEDMASVPKELCSGKTVKGPCQAVPDKEGGVGEEKTALRN